jgi:hypothetical protein
MTYRLLIVILISFVFSSCSYLPEPLDDPAISTFGKKCNAKNWSYIWIHKRGQNLTASEEKCVIPIKLED